MTTMAPELVVPILGAWGDGRPYPKEETYPMLQHTAKDFTPEFVDRVVKRYLEYGLLRGRKDGQILGHLYIQITEKGQDALDFYRNMHHRDPEEGVLF